MKVVYILWRRELNLLYLKYNKELVGVFGSEEGAEKEKRDAPKSHCEKDCYYEIDIEKVK